MKVRVSVTTTRARLGLLFYSLQSLKRQNFSDFVIVVNLSREPYLFDEGIDVVPAWLSGDKVEINFVENCGPYRKLLPQIHKISADDILVTADDDILYSEDWLGRLVGMATENTDAIVCCRARKIRRNLMGRFQNYSHWELCTTVERGSDLLPTCGSGAVFRKNLLDLEFLSDGAYRKYAPTTDDLWFRLASIRKNVEVQVDPTIDRENGYIQHGSGLKEVNFYWLKKQYPLYRRVLTKIRNKASNYLGIPICENDVAWRRSWKYSGLSISGLFRQKV